MKTPRLLSLAAAALTPFTLSTAAPRTASAADSPADAAAPAAAEDLSQFDTADKLFAHLAELREHPNPPPRTREDVQALVHRLTAAAAEFQKRYPQDPRRWDAEYSGLQAEELADRLDGREPDLGKLEEGFGGIAAAQEAPATVKASARYALIQVHAMKVKEEKLTPELDREMQAFAHDYPSDPRVAEVQETRVDEMRKSDPAGADALLDQLAADSNPAVARMAKGELAQRDLKKKPLDLKFTAVDGTAVDLANLRGKVVLVDFWATWCGPCMGEVPNVVATYNELHPKGFEIVGISLDQSKESLLKVTKEKGMVWPQYFDGKGWENQISSQYGIKSIPAMWLIDKKGMIVDTEAREDLKGKVQKLLAQ